MLQSRKGGRRQSQLAVATAFSCRTRWKLAYFMHLCIVIDAAAGGLIMNADVTTRKRRNIHEHGSCLTSSYIQIGIYKQRKRCEMCDSGCSVSDIRNTQPTHAVVCRTNGPLTIPHMTKGTTPARCQSGQTSTRRLSFPSSQQSAHTAHRAGHTLAGTASTYKLRSSIALTHNTRQDGINVLVTDNTLTLPVTTRSPP